MFRNNAFFNVECATNVVIWGQSFSLASPRKLLPPRLTSPCASTESDKHVIAFRQIKIAVFRRTHSGGGGKRRAAQYLVRDEPRLGIFAISIRREALIGLDKGKGPSPQRPPAKSRG